MTTIIKKKSKKGVAEQKFSRAISLKGVDTHKHCGVIKLKKDALQIQKELRDEWE
jgi:hypothetical protein